MAHHRQAPPGCPADAFAPNPWICIRRDDSVTFTIDRSEMGQGVATSLSMLIAEELEVDLDKVRVEFAPADHTYDNRIFHEQTTGGSNSVRAAWTFLREMGATARETLIEAARLAWGVPRGECRAEHGAVVHVSSGRRLRYGELVERASKLKPPKRAPLKNPDAFRVIGKPAARIDLWDMCMGHTRYGIDFTLPEMRVAVVARCPVFGGRVERVDARRARGVNGVRDIVEIESGVAVVADDFWSAQKGREALEIAWDEGPNADLSSAAIWARFEEAAQREGEPSRDDGNALRRLHQADHVIEAVYRTPYAAHGTLEPMNCTAWVRADRCEVWVGTQAQSEARRVAARASGLPETKVEIHTLHLGGSFGRRQEQDFVQEAVTLSKAIGGPVQVIWTRDDDMQHDAYRPANHTVLRAALDADGFPLAWHQKTVGPAASLDGIKVPYDIRNVRLEQIEEDPGVPTGAWRAVGASQNAFPVECFVDELAHAAGVDPCAYRRHLLRRVPRQRAVLDIAAEKADWGSPLGAGRARGIATYPSFGSWVAQVAEVSVIGAEIRVDRVVCAIDCGQTVNPDTVVAQMEGSVAWALSAAIKGEITVERGRVPQRSFADYPIITLPEMPAVDVHIVESREAPGGVGEPGVPPLAPAVANAVFAATGRRLRSLPLRLAE